MNAADSVLTVHRLHGPLWSWGFPVLIFAVAAWATFALYRHFAQQRDEIEAAAKAAGERMEEG